MQNVLSLLAAAAAFIAVDNVFQHKEIPLPSPPFQIVGAITVFCIVKTISVAYTLWRRRS